MSNENKINSITSQSSLMGQGEAPSLFIKARAYQGVSGSGEIMWYQKYAYVNCTRIEDGYCIGSSKKELNERMAELERKVVIIQVVIIQIEDGA